MNINRRTFLKRMNWTLAGIIGMLGFSGCDKIGIGSVEYGVPHSDLTVKGAVVNKATGKPIEGIRVGYSCEFCTGTMYGVIPAPYKPKAHVMTNAKGEFKLTERSYNLQSNENGQIPVFVEDINNEENRLYQSEYLEVDFSKGEHSGKSTHWYEGEYTVALNVELTEIEDQ